MTPSTPTYTKKTVLLSRLAFALVVFMLASCAQVVAPGGGVRDKVAPKVVKWSPDSAQLNFNSKTIELVFDEYIQLKDLNNQLIISPPFAKTPDFKIKNKTLTIDLSKEELKPNTTYSINFGNALQDVNEGNPKENFRYIFSTGAYIDSLHIKGKVQNAFDHKTEKGLLVMLYSDINDSAVYKDQPDYFGKTNTEGSFEINNIRPGKYKIYAIKDANGNFKYDGEPESIAFAEGSINPADDKELLLELFQEKPKKLQVKKYMHSSYGKIIITFNQGSDSLHVNNLSNTLKGVQEQVEFSKHKDTLTYWIKNYDKDSLKLQVSNGTSIIDTLEFKMIKKEEALKAKRNPLKLYVVNNFNGNQSFDLHAPIHLKFSQPIESFDEHANARMKEDSIPMKHLGFSKDFVTETGDILICLWDSTAKAEDPNHKGVFVDAPIKSSILDLKESTNYHLLILPKTFTDIFGLTNDSIKIDFKTREQKFYGSLKLTVHLTESEKNTSTTGQYIVQLMNEQEVVIREEFIRNSSELLFEYLYPNKYKIKLIYDSNANDKWDSGDYLKKVQPEEVLYNPELITIRSNWDADIEWKIAK